MKHLTVKEFKDLLEDEYPVDDQYIIFEHEHENGMAEEYIVDYIHNYRCANEGEECDIYIILKPFKKDIA